MKTIDEMLDSVAVLVGASAPSAPQKTEKPVPKPMEKNPVSVGNVYKKLTLDFAKEIAYAVELAAKTMNLNVVVAVVNEGANLMLLNAMDDSYIASVDVARDKAYTAAALRMPTYKALEMSRGGELDGLTNGNGIMLLGGGEPLMAGDKLYGGVGVSGGTKEQDILLARIASEIFRLKIEKEGLR